MNIAGIGIISARGRGVESLEEALEKGWFPPQKKEDSLSEESLPAYRVKQEYITDKTVLKKIRRSDRFSKMAVLASWDAIKDSNLPFDEVKSSLGIIIATAFGPHATTFRFLDDILDYGDKNVSPTTFSNSVHNAAGSYIAFVLGSQGPTVTLAQFISPFHQALILAQSWLQEGRCENVLVGGVDEYAKVMEYVCSHKLKIAKDGKIRPFDFSKTPAAVPGEGSLFFLMTKDKSGKDYCKISSVSMDNTSHLEGEPDIYIFDSDGMAGDETNYNNLITSNVSISSYAPIFGSMLIGSAFSCASAALMLKNQIIYGCPILDNPHAANLNETTENFTLKKIYCIKYSCGDKRALVGLEK